MARKVFTIARAIAKAAHSPIDAVVLVWDMDSQGDDRPAGVAAARDEALTWAPFQIICGFPDPEREACFAAET
jgi:hypothetical protein